MQFLIINPNSTASMTDTMVAAATPVLAVGSHVSGVTAAYGPESIEGYYDEVFAIPPMLEALAQYGEDIDGLVVGCFDDTGVDAARTIADVPVIGLCQAAMQTATVLAGSFSVVTTLGRSVPALEHLALKYGYERHCRKVRACEVPVLELDSGAGNARTLLRAEISSALREDGSEAIVLGCAGMALFAAELTEEFGVPVIEGVTAGIKIVEGLAALGLKTTGHGGYGTPRAKTYKGEYARHAPAANSP
jgi:allantoin racemase